MKKSILSFVVIVAFLHQMSASNEAQIFAEGNKAYQEKNYDEAIKIYEALLRQNWESPDLEYNLGNAWYKKGSNGRAILHYERTLLQAPNHKEAQQNLEFLRSKMNNPIEPLPPFFLAKWWVKIRGLLPPTAMSILGILFWWLGFGALSVWIMGKTRSQKKWGLIAGIGLTVLSFLPFALALSRTSFEKEPNQAILLQKSAILHNAPEERAGEVQTLEEGTKLERLEFLEGWWQVKLEDGEVGWLPSETLERI